ncbi:MAG: VOC family protein [Phycisphaerae bacterium]
MLAIGDIHIFVHDFELALRFYRDGLSLRVAEREVSAHSAFARLDFPDGGPSIRLFGSVEAWPESTRPAVGTRPTIRFDVTVSDFDATLVRLLEAGGKQADEIEAYGGIRVVTIADPDGNTFELLELPREGG